MSLNALVIGGSRNIGYHAALRILASGATVTFLLRSPSVFDQDEAIKEYVQQGKAKLFKGDAYVQDDVKNALKEASKAQVVDIIIFTVGGTPKFHPLKGMVITPANLVTQCVLNVLCALPPPSDHQPKIIVISSTGLTRSGHAALPFFLKPLYGYLLTVPHKDKLGMERAIAHSAGWEWDVKEGGEPGEDIMGPGDWKTREGLPAPGTLKKVLVVRPALLTNGECLADKPGGKYRVGENELGGWKVSRQDVAHFVADVALNKWDQYENKIVNVAY